MKSAISSHVYKMRKTYHNTIVSTNKCGQGYFTETHSEYSCKNRENKHFTLATLTSPAKADATQKRRPIRFKNFNAWWILLVNQTRLLDQHQTNLLSLFASCNSRE